MLLLSGSAWLELELECVFEITTLISNCWSSIPRTATLSTFYQNNLPLFKTENWNWLSLHYWRLSLQPCYPSLQSWRGLCRRVRCRGYQGSWHSHYWVSNPHPLFGHQSSCLQRGGTPGFTPQGHHLWGIPSKAGHLQSRFLCNHPAITSGRVCSDNCQEKQLACWWSRKEDRLLGEGT